MTFRKDSITFYESQIAFVFFLILSLYLMPTIGFGLSFIFIFIIFFILFVDPRLKSEFITINETGIFCCKSGEQIWAYTWDDIAELHRSSRFRQPSVEIVVYSSRKPGLYKITGDYFQLNRTARKAVEKYYGQLKKKSKNQGVYDYT